MNDLQLFNHPDFGELHMIEIDGKPYAAATDTARALGYANPRAAIIRHCKGVMKRDGVSHVTNQYGITTEQKVEMNFIPEGDLYRLIVNSQLPSAEKFEIWVFDEVLPSIRKHGGYVVPQLTQAEMMLQMAQNTVELERQLGEVKAEVKQIGGKLDTALQVFAKPGSDWKDSMELAIREMTGDGGWDLIKIKGKLYQELEIVANADLQSRLTRKRNRMKKQGATRREYMAMNKMDIISHDKQLRPIFESIVRKYRAVYAQE